MNNTMDAPGLLSDIKMKRRGFATVGTSSSFFLSFFGNFVSSTLIRILSKLTVLLRLKRWIETGDEGSTKFNNLLIIF